MTHLSTRTQAKLDALFDDVQRDGPGFAVGVALEGAPVYRRCAGMAILGQPGQITPATPMRIGSITKQMTCLAALLLAADGVLNMDASVRRYLPELPVLDGEPSLRQLMWHAGGHRCYLDAGLLSDGLAVKPQGEALAAQVRQRRGNGAPGQSLIYSNGGYHLLSLAMERASGVAINDILKSRLFAPLGMHATTLAPDDLEPPPDMATHMVGGVETGYRRGVFPSRELLGEGGVVSTVDDMLLWLAELRRHSLGTASVWEQMFACPELASGFRSQYAAGLFIEPYRGMRMINHAGNVVGGASHLLALPEAGLDVIVMTNGAPVDAIGLAERIADIVLQLGDAPARKLACSTDYPGWTGTYLCEESGMLCALSDEGGQLGLSIYQSPPEILEVGAAGLELSFSRNSAGHFLIPFGSHGAEVKEFDLVDCGISHRMKRLDTAALGTDALDGCYACPDLYATAVVTDRRTMLIQGRFGHNRLRIEPLANGLYSLRSEDPGMPRGALLRVRRNGAAVEALEIDMARTRGLVFQRRPEAA